ncbi:MAG: thrombospondin type 3 repeat-containing protein [archaeon]
MKVILEKEVPNMAKALLYVLVLVIFSGFVAASGCYIDWNGGNDGCKAVYSWGNNVNINNVVKNTAKNDPGTEYMAWCPYDGATPYAREVKAACSCPDLHPAPGECVTSTCGACGNPVTKCSPAPKPVCGDGKVNRASEECDDGNSNNYDNCRNDCTRPICGDGIKDSNEACDLGNKNGQVCTPGWNGECTYCTDSCKYETVKGPTCKDECIRGENMCSGNDLWECGNYDNDPCTEWRVKQDCLSRTESRPYDVCENDNSVSYKDITEGYCKENGNRDYCTTEKHTEKMIETDCGETYCTYTQDCYMNDVYETATCQKKGCFAGQCFSEETKKIYKDEDCGDDSKTGEYCDGENIVYGETERTCVDNENDAYCKVDPNTVVVENCGPDACTEFTEMDIFTPEYVKDDESCTENNYPYCALDSEAYDFCLNEEILEQTYCDGNDHAFEEFDCSSLTGCYDFSFVSCVYCPQDDGSCQKTSCERTGKEYREYSCGAGACTYNVNQSQDTDSDRIDDRCDECIDVDHDGTCDDKDNCVGLNNPSQIDSDNDGIGNACDNDKDGDGYSGRIDCNDWNAKIHPNAKEILNNGIDDDCDAGTLDKGVYSPKEALYIDILYDETSVKPGEEMELVITVTNNDIKELKDVQILVSTSTQFTSSLIRKLETGETLDRVFTIKLPDKPGFEPLRISVSNLDYKRTIYREIMLRD